MTGRHASRPQPRMVQADLPEQIVESKQPALHSDRGTDLNFRHGPTVPSHRNAGGQQCTRSRQGGPLADDLGKAPAAQDSSSHVRYRTALSNHTLQHAAQHLKGT